MTASIIRGALNTISFEAAAHLGRDGPRSHGCRILTWRERLGSVSRHHGGCSRHRDVAVAFGRCFRLEAGVIHPRNCSRFRRND